MARQFEQHVYGGIYIPTATGLTNLFDLISKTDTTQDLIDQAITDTATLYITLNHAVSNFELRQVSIGYNDTAAVDDLANVYLIEGPEAEDSAQAIKTRFVSGAVTEGLRTATDTVTPINLDTAGRVYFITDWTTAVINCGAAGEYFYLRIDGVTMEDV